MWIPFFKKGEWSSDFMDCNIHKTSPERPAESSQRLFNLHIIRFSVWTLPLYGSSGLCLVDVSADTQRQPRSPKSPFTYSAEPLMASERRKKKLQGCGMKVGLSVAGDFWSGMCESRIVLQLKPKCGPADLVGLA